MRKDFLVGTQKAGTKMRSGTERQNLEKNICNIRKGRYLLWFLQIIKKFYKKGC